MSGMHGTGRLNDYRVACAASKVLASVISRMVQGTKLIPSQKLPL